MVVKVAFATILIIKKEKLTPRRQAPMIVIEDSESTLNERSESNGLENSYRFTTTNNEMADKLAKKIHHAFSDIELNYSRAPGPHNIDRMHILFKMKE